MWVMTFSKTDIIKFGDFDDYNLLNFPNIFNNT